jgi:RNA ligase
LSTTPDETDQYDALSALSDEQLVDLCLNYSIPFVSRQSALERLSTLSPDSDSSGYRNPQLSDLGISWQQIADSVKDGLISERQHPEMDYWIYNYTPVAQNQQVWNPATLACRGLILDMDDNVIARPFPKFFNADLNDLTDKMNDQSWLVQEKMDGSLGISYRTPSGRLQIATRGSFTSEQALWANQWLADRPGIGLGIPDDETWLFEIVFPENRIVVDYKGAEGLYLLARIHTLTGLDLRLADADWPSELIVQEYSTMTDIYKPKSTADQAEGVVIKFPLTGERFKIKYKDYVRVHRYAFAFSPKTVWESMAAGTGVDINLLPAHMRDEAIALVCGFGLRYAEIEAAAKSLLSKYPVFVTRKNFAIAHQGNEALVVAFAMLDGKPYESKIWRLLKP